MAHRALLQNLQSQVGNFSKRFVTDRGHVSRDITHITQEGKEEEWRKGAEARVAVVGDQQN
jgi:hypothetical protein